MRKTRTNEHYGFAKLMFSGDGQAGFTHSLYSTKHFPWCPKSYEISKNVTFVELRCVFLGLVALFSWSFCLRFFFGGFRVESSHVSKQ